MTTWEDFALCRGEIQNYRDAALATTESERYYKRGAKWIGWSLRKCTKRF